MSWPATWLSLLAEFETGDRDEHQGRLDALAEARQEGVEGIRELEGTLGDLAAAPDVVVVALLLSYRGEQAWDRLFAVVDRMRPELAARPFVRQQHAFALSRAGRGVEAERILLALREEHGPSPETNGILGRVYKDWFQAARGAGDEKTAEHRLRQAIDTYVEGHDADPSNPYPGLNALSLMEFTYPRPARRDSLLGEVTSASRRRLLSDGTAYWDYATEWELAVLEGNESTARSALERAQEVVEEPWQVASTSYNAHMLQAAWVARGLAVASWVSSLTERLDAMIPSGGPPVPPQGPPVSGAPPGGPTTPPPSGSAPAEPGGTPGPEAGAAEGPPGTGGPVSPPSPGGIRRLLSWVKNLVVKTTVVALVGGGATVALLKFGPEPISKPIENALPVQILQRFPFLLPEPGDSGRPEPGAPSDAQEVAEGPTWPTGVGELEPLLEELARLRGADPGSGGDPGAGEDPGAAEDPGAGEDPGAAEDPGAGEDPGAAEDPGAGEDPGAEEDPGTGGEAPDPEEKIKEEIGDLIDGFLGENVGDGASPQDVEEVLGPVDPGNVYKVPGGGGEIWCYPIPGLDEVVEVRFDRNKAGELAVHHAGFGECGRGRRDPPEADPEPGSMDPVVLGTGAVQVTLRWESDADLDLFVTDPEGNRLFYNNRKPEGAAGELDVDANSSCQDPMDSPVENVFWPDGEAPVGEYLVEVSLFSPCDSSGSQEFVIEVTIDGQVVERVSGAMAEAGETREFVRFDYPTGAAGGVQLLVDCDAASAVLHAFSGPGCHPVTATGVSFARLDPGTTAVLFPTGDCSGAQSRSITSSLDLCRALYPDDSEVNDNVRSVRIAGGPTRFVDPGDDTALAPTATERIDTGVYYRLTNSLLGEGRSFDTYSDGENQPFMGQTGEYSGQLWRLTPVGDGYYRLTNSFLGEGRSLDTYSGDENQPFMGQTGNYSGQLWRLAPAGDGYYRLTNSFLGEGRSLDTYPDGENQPFMGETGDASGQLWKLTPGPPIPEE